MWPARREEALGRAEARFPPLLRGGGSVVDSEPARGSWRKSTASTGGGSECAEVAFDGDVVRMRHSHDPSGPVLTFSLAEWAAFLTGVRQGEFDVSADGH